MVILVLNISLKKGALRLWETEFGDAAEEVENGPPKTPKRFVGPVTQRAPEDPSLEIGNRILLRDISGEEK